MKSCNVLNAFLLSNPFYRGMVEEIVLIGTGICGLIFSWKTFYIFPLSNILGGVLVLLSFAFHQWKEKNHKQAHKESRDIKTIVTT